MSVNAKLALAGRSVLAGLGVWGLSGCVYDPYYTGGVYPATPVVSGSVFVSTGSPYWAYDPYRYLYFDYRRRCYYDPWLYGYYPVGCVPPPLVGVPHPYGWRPGRGVCPPPSSIRNVVIHNPHQRVDLIRQSNHPWARGVRVNPLPLEVHMRQNPAVWANQVPSPPAGAVNRGGPGVGGPPASGRNPFPAGQGGGTGGFGQPPTNQWTAPPAPAGRSSGGAPSRSNRRSGSWFDTPVAAPAPVVPPQAGGMSGRGGGPATGAGQGPGGPAGPAPMPRVAPPPAPPPPAASAPAQEAPPGAPARPVGYGRVRGR